MTAKSMTGLEKAAVLLKSLPGEVMDKVLRRLMDSRHAGVIRTELEKLKQDGQLSGKLAEVLDEAAKILDDARKPEQSAKGQAGGAPRHRRRRSIFAWRGSRARRRGQPNPSWRPSR